MSNRIFRILILILLLGNSATQQLSNRLYASGVGTTGAAFLKVGAGARATGMGEAFVGVSDDVDAIYWNPAGLTQIKSKEVNFMYNFYMINPAFQNMGYTYLAYAQPLIIKEKNLGAVGANFIYGNYGTFLGYDENGNKSANFACSDLLVTFAYARDVNVKGIDLALGANLKIISETLADRNALSIGFDFGGLYKFKKMPLSVGLTVQNLGTPLTFISEPAPLPAMIKLGAGYRMSINSLSNILISSDLLMPFDSIMGFRMGAEYVYNEMFAARLGYKIDSAININPLAGLTVGVGFKWNKYSADFAFIPYGDMGNAYRLSLGATF